MQPVEVSDYDQLIAALRARRDELEVTFEVVDATSGLQSGYSAKIMCNPPIKGLGSVSLGPLLGTLGLRLLVIPDEEALARVRAQLTPRNVLLARRMLAQQLPVAVDRKRGFLCLPAIRKSRRCFGRSESC